MRNMLKVLALLLGFAAMTRAQDAIVDSVPTVLVGRWEGTAALDSGLLAVGAPVRLTIARDGTVTGTVGDATLRNGRMARNPSVFSRLFGLGTKWMVEGMLEGPLTSAPALRRERTKMPLDLVDDALAGDFNAMGGGALVSVRMRLERVP